MSWDSLIADAAETVMETFGDKVLVDDTLQCMAIIDVYPKISGSTYEPITEDHTATIFLRSEIEDEDGEGLSSGIRIDAPDGNSYEVESVCEEKTNKHYLAYWVKKVDV